MMITKEDSFDLHITWDFPDAKRYAFAFIILFVSLIIIYGNSFHCEFHFDDFPNIVNNPNLHLKSLSWEEIKKTFYGANDVGTRIIRPLSYFSLGLNYYFGKTNVFGYHVVNFIIHYIASIFLFLFIYNTLHLPLLKGRYSKIAYSVSLLSTFLWATHPIQVTAVTYIVQRMASMAGMFYIMAIYFYLKGRKSQGAWGRTQGAVKYFVLCGIASFLSFASKENAAMLPVSLFLFDLFLIQGVTRENLKYHFRILVIPMLILLGLGLFYIQADIASVIEAYNNRPFTPLERLLTQPRIILFYLSLLFYPIDSRLTFLYDVDISKSLFIPWTTLPAIMSIFVIIGTALWLCQKRPLIAYCILFFFVNHLTESSILPLELIYEHRNYLPSMLLFILPSILMLKIIDYFSYTKPIQFLFVFVFTFVLSAQAHTVHSRNYIFKDALTFWQDNVKKIPDLSRPHNNLGIYYWDKGFYSMAFKKFETALQIDRASTLTASAIYHENIGMYYIRTKEHLKALWHFLSSLRIYQDHPCPRTYFGIALLHCDLENFTLSQEFIEKSLSYDPLKERYLLLKSMILLKLGKVDESIRLAQKVMTLNPDYDVYLIVLAEAFRKKGKYEESIRYWEDFLKKNPKYIKGHLALIELLSITEKGEKLNRIVGRLMYLKGEKSYISLIHEKEKDSDIFVYTPDPDILLPAIKKVLLDQSKQIDILINGK